MEYEKLVPLLAGATILVVLTAPTVRAIFLNLREARRIRRHKKNLPGPLLGVVYPETENSKTKDKK